MRQMILGRKLVYCLFAALFVSVLFSGCVSSVKERKEESAKKEGEAVGTGKYYHFEDIRVPKELNYQQKRAMVYETTGFKAGVVYFTKWRLDTESLVDFFTYHMEKDNWKLVNSFKGKESILNFLKPNKTCTIKISDNWYNKAEVEIRVGPLEEKKM
ncbi:MAG: hypothetical protein FJ106_00485 [Deltaproteobacteria bacterium]|nr:hypothetical protein [Deltaproteobacteria bacterium]